jgi:Ca-activated chloride channel family protein
MNRRVALRLGLCLVGMLLLAALIRLGVAGPVPGPVPVDETLRLSLAGRTVELLAPHWLYLLTVLPALWLTETWSLVDFSRVQRALSLAVRALFVASLALALARPALVGERQALCTVVLVDVSDSVSSRQLEEARMVIEELRREQAARRRRGEETRLELVVFAARPHLVALPPEGTPLAPLPRPAPSGQDGKEGGDRGDASDLEAALRLAYGLYPPGMTRRALLLSDGNQTRGDLLAEAAAARARGVRLDTRVFAARADDEVLVRELTLPGTGPSGVRLGAPFTVTAEVYASRAVAATLTLYQDRIVNPHGGPEGGRRRVVLQPGRNRYTFPSRVDEPGVVEYRLQIAELPADFRDQFAANNQAQATVLVAGRPRVLYVEGEAAAARYLNAALERGGSLVDVRGASGLPSSAQALARYDLVVLSDVPASELSPDQMAALEAHVRDAGGGLLMAGGESAFGAGGYSGTSLERLLPVRFDTEKKREQPSLALLLCIDRSGSMQAEGKLELAKEAARASAELLSGDDLIGVIAFDAQAQPLVRLQRAQNRLRIGADIARLVPGGGTNILAPLEEAYQELLSARAKIKHVILLTDGQASYDGIAERVAEMAQAHITVSAIGVGEGADKTLLTMIAERGGGRFYFTQDAANVPKIFIKETTEVARSALVEQPVRPRVARRAEVLEGVDFAAAPALRGFVSTRAKPLAETLLATDTTGEPLLVRWRVGLGQAAMWTSDVKNRWASDWLRWPGYGQLFAQLGRSLLRERAHLSAGTGESAYPMVTQVEAPAVHVIIDAVAGDDRFVNGLSTVLEVTPAGRRQAERVVPLAQTAPGRYEGDFTLDRYGAFALRALHRRGPGSSDEGRVVAESAGTVSVPYPREYLALPPDRVLLGEAAAASGGRLDPSAQEHLDPGTERIPWRRERWQPLVYLAALLLVLDVLLRRVPLGQRRHSTT